MPVDIESGDLNGDGKPEMVVAADKPITAIDSNGKVLWRFATTPPAQTVAVGDIDGDGHDDVAAYGGFQPSNLYAISGSGAEFWRYPLPAGANVQIGDVTGDGRNEVIAASTSTLFVFDSEGSVLFTRTFPPYITSIVLGDVADGGGLEVVVSYGFTCPSCGVQVVDGSNNIVWNFSTPVRLGQAVTGDLNADGRADVIVGELDYYSGNAYAIDSSGAVLWKFEQGKPVFPYAIAFALGDVDGDGALDIAFGSADGHVYVISANGQMTWRFDVHAPITQVAVGDLDGDARLEVAASTIGLQRVGARGVYGIDSDGTQLWFWPRVNVSSVKGFNDLVIADVNGDGRDDVLAIQADQSDTGHYGRLFALSDPRAQP
jgi:hypothetical protein